MSVTIANFSGALIIFVFAVFLRPLTEGTRRSFALWTMALVLVGIACVLLSLRGQIPDSISIIVANAALLMAHFLRPNALNLFFKRDIRLIWLPFAATSCWLVLCMFPQFREDLLARVVFVQGAILIEIVISATICLKGNSSRLVTGWMLFAALLLELSGNIFFLVSQSIGQFPSFQASFGLLLTNTYLGIILAAVALTIILVPAMAIELIQQHLQDEAWRDPVTGLPNRRSFERETRKILMRQSQCKQPHALIVFDLDGYSDATHRFGDCMGTSLLRLAAKVSRQASPDSAMIGRVTQDEFTIFLPEATRSSAQALAKQIGATVRFEAARASGGRITLSLSAGIYWGWSSRNLAEVQEIAGACLRRAKAVKPGSIMINSPVAVSGETNRPPQHEMSFNQSNAA